MALGPESENHNTSIFTTIISLVAIRYHLFCTLRFLCVFAYMAPTRYILPVLQCPVTLRLIRASLARLPGCRSNPWFDPWFNSRWTPTFLGSKMILSDAGRLDCCGVLRWFTTLLQAAAAVGIQQSVHKVTGVQLGPVLIRRCAPSCFFPSFSLHFERALKTTRHTWIFHWI